MAFQRIVTRTLPDGSTAKVHPFHLSLEGLESNLLCRDEEDYDVVEKFMYVSAWQCNVLVVSHVRHALAYIFRNVMELGIRPEDYPWCSYRALFVNGVSTDGVRKVSALTRREKEALMHTHLDLSRVPWLLDRDGHLVSVTCCYHTTVPQLARCLRLDRAEVKRALGKK